MEATCCKCEAVLLIEEADMKAPDYTDHYGFNCMICGHFNVTTSNAVPERIRNNVNKNRKYRSSSAWD
jgi:hypothetical protein